MNLELALATKKIAALTAKGFGYFVCVQAAMSLLVSQGFSVEYSQKIAEQAFDLVV